MTDILRYMFDWLGCMLAELDAWLVHCIFDWLDCKLAELVGWLVRRHETEGPRDWECGGMD